MRSFRFCLLCLVLGLGSAASALEPAYSGQFGYAEEPALRPYKWMWVGVKALGHQTKMGFVRGNMNTPVIGTVETFRGIRKGTVDLAEDTWNGMLYRPVPPKGAHKVQGRANNYIDNDLFLRNATDFAASALVWKWYAWPIQKVVDLAPLESDEKVEIRLEHAQRVRDSRREAEMVRQEQRRLIDETPVEIAQRKHIDNPHTYGSAKSEQKQLRKKEEDYTGNLLKLRAVRRARVE